MRDFQKKCGDVDVVYGLWEDCVGSCESGVLDENAENDGNGKDDGENDKEDGLVYSFKRGNNGNDPQPTPLPTNSTRQRTLKFNTLTKSYFGPAYAKATKTQRATHLSNNGDGDILVIENMTQLADIPYADRFRIVERWVVEVVDVENNETDADVYNNKQQPMKPQSIGEASSATSLEASSQQNDDGMMDNNTKLSSTTTKCCRLTVHAEVQLLKPCSWESQIRKKASETFTEILSEWCKSATVALKATEERKQRKRLRLDFEGDRLEEGVGSGSNNNNNPISGNGTLVRLQRPPSLRIPSTAMSASTPLSARASQLFAKHRRNFDELDKRIAKGDLEWCSVEVMHSLLQSPLSVSSGNAGGGSDGFATIMEYPSLNEYEITSPSMMGSTDDDYDNISDGEMDGSRRVGKATVIMRRRSRKLFKKLSSRVISKSSSKQQQQPR